MTEKNGKLFRKEGESTMITDRENEKCEIMKRKCEKTHERRSNGKGNEKMYTNINWNKRKTEKKT